MSTTDAVRIYPFHMPIADMDDLFHVRCDEHPDFGFCGTLAEAEFVRAQHLFQAHPMTPAEHDGPDVHPEDSCHRCGAANASWWAPSPVWNLVMGFPDQAHDGIVCPSCFAALAEAKGAKGPWRFAPRVWPEGVSLTHVDGRAWDHQAERWRDGPVGEVPPEGLREVLTAHRLAGMSGYGITHRPCACGGWVGKPFDHPTHQADAVLAALPTRSDETWATLLRRLHDAERERDEARAEVGRLRAGMDELRRRIDRLPTRHGTGIDGCVPLGAVTRLADDLDGEVRP